MCKAKQYLDKNALLNLYYSYIYPYFIYCIKVWGNASHCHLNLLFLLQKKIIRIMPVSPYLAHTKTLLSIMRFFLLINQYSTGLQ